MTTTDDELLDRIADDYLQRLRAGEVPLIAEIAAAHPQIAGRIRTTLPAVAAAERALAQLTPQPAPEQQS
jgi:hypothetical protein